MCAREIASFIVMTVFLLNFPSSLTSFSPQGGPSRLMACHLLPGEGFIIRRSHNSQVGCVFHSTSSLSLRAQRGNLYPPHPSRLMACHLLPGEGLNVVTNFLFVIANEVTA